MDWILVPLPKQTLTEKIEDKIFSIYFKLEFIIYRFLIKHTKVCHGFERPCFNYGYRQRQNTQYVDDERNYVHLCDECMIQNEEYWAEMWADYYSSRL